MKNITIVFSVLTLFFGWQTAVAMVYCKTDTINTNAVNILCIPTIYISPDMSVRTNRTVLKESRKTVHAIETMALTCDVLKDMGLSYTKIYFDHENRLRKYENVTNSDSEGYILKTWYDEFGNLIL